MSEKDDEKSSLTFPNDPIYSIMEETKQDPAVALVNWTRLFVTHDRRMYNAFERLVGEDRALKMHKRVWENPTDPVLPILSGNFSGPLDAVGAFVRAFIVHDFYCFWIMVEECGETKAIETHHSIWENQDLEGGEHAMEDLGATEKMTWKEVMDRYFLATHNEGLPFYLVDETEEELVVETKQCVYYDSMCHVFGDDWGDRHLHKIAVESTDRTIECFLAGIGQEDKMQGVMTKHRCHGDEACQVVFTKRDRELPIVDWGMHGEDRDYAERT